MSAPLVVNLADGTVWTRREAVRDGQSLYALAGCGRCPELVMATYGELAEHGIAGTADVLPMPAGPEPLVLSEEREQEIRSLDLLSMMSDQVAPVISGHLAVLLNEVARLRAVRAAVGDEVARFGIYGAALPATKALVKRADELVTENGRLRSRVTELERLLADAPVAVTLTERAVGGPGRGPGGCAACGSLPETWCPACAACEAGCFDGFKDNPCRHEGAVWGPLPVDRLTRTYMPVAVLREDAPHGDLPGSGGAR